MSASNPPDPNVNTFNNLYWISGDTALTQEVADKRYLRFPTAQGTENLAAINVNGVATFSSNIEVGSSTTTNLTPVVDFNKSLVNLGSSGNGKVEVECELNVGGFGEINMEGSQLLLQANAYINQGATNTTANSLGLTNFADDINTIAPITIDLPAASNTGLVLIDAGISQSGSVVNGLQTITMNANQEVQLGDAGSFILNDYGNSTADNFAITTDPSTKILKMRSNTQTSPTDVITYTPSLQQLDFPVPNPPTCSASSTISLTDDSNKLPSTAWVKDYVASVPSTIPADLTPNSVTITPTTSPPNLTCGVKNYYNEGAIVAVDTFVPYQDTGSKQVKQYFARLVFNPSRALGGGSNLAGIYQNTQVRTTLSLTDNNNVAYWGTQYGVINYYSTAVIALNYNYQQYYNVNINTKDNSSQGVSFILKNTGSNNNGGFSGIVPDIYVEKFAGQNWYNFYFLNGPFSSGGSSGFVTNWNASFTIELLNGGQSVDATSSVWLEEYVVAVNV